MLLHHFINARERATQIKKFEWACQTISLLRRLDSALCDTIEAWLSFNSPNDNLAYFSEISPESQRALYNIQLIFQQLQGNRRRLLLLKNYCLEFLSNVSQILSTFRSGYNYKNLY